MSSFKSYQQTWLEQKRDENAPVMTGLIGISDRRDTAQYGYDYRHCQDHIWRLRVAFIHAPATAPFASNAIQDACTAQRVTKPLLQAVQPFDSVNNLCSFSLHHDRPAFVISHMIDSRQKTVTSFIKEGIFRASQAETPDNMTTRLTTDKKTLPRLLEIIMNKNLADKDFLLNDGLSPGYKKHSSLVSFETMKRERVYANYIHYLMQYTNHKFAAHAQDNNIPYIYRAGWDQKGTSNGASEICSIEPSYHRNGYDPYAYVVSPLQRIVDLGNQYNTTAVMNNKQPPLSNANMLFIANMANLHAEDSRLRRPAIKQPG